VVDDITRTINVGASFTVEKVDGYDDYYTYFAYVHSALIKLGPAVHVHDFVTIWNNELCFEGRWEVTITCTSCDYNYHAHGFPQDHIDAILEADDNGSDFWYCPICGTSGSKNIWIIP